MTLDGEKPTDEAAMGTTIAETALPAQPPAPLRVWTVFAVFVAAFCAAIFAQVAIALVFVLRQIAAGESPQSAVELIVKPWGFVSILLASQLAFLGSWWLASTFGDRRGRAFRPIGKSALPWAAYPCLAVTSLGALWVGGLLGEVATRLFGQWSAGMSTDFFQLLNWPGGIAFVLLIALVPGFVEELFFRGYMQRRLLARWSPATAIAVTALVFAAFHGTPVWAAVVLPLGFWLGFLAWRTGSLWPGICCHAFVNGSVNLWRVCVGLEALPPEMPSGAYYAGLGMVAACAALSSWILIRYRPAPVSGLPAD